MAIAEILLELFQEYSLFLAFLSGLFVGDLMLILGIMTGVGEANLFLIIFFGLIGGVIHDICLYIISNSNLMKFVKKKYELSGKKNKIVNFVEKLGNGNYFWPLLIAKFVYGARSAVTLYVAHNHKSFKKYLFIVSTTELIWISTITSIGWVAGRGFTTILRLFRGAEKVLLVIFFGAILIYLIHKLVIFLLLKKSRAQLKTNSGLASSSFSPVKL